MQYLITMENVCETAHILTVHDCELLGIEYEEVAENGDTRYPEKAQDIFNRYYGVLEENLLQVQVCPHDKPYYDHGAKCGLCGAQMP